MIEFVVINPDHCISLSSAYAVARFDRGVHGAVRWFKVFDGREMYCHSDPLEVIGELVKWLQLQEQLWELVNADHRD